MSYINVPTPVLQIDFSFVLQEIRDMYLQDALGETINGIAPLVRDKQLSRYVSQKYLRALDRRGLRGELIFPIPCILEANPHLLGYYRLLLGYSQKAFYTKEFGILRFKEMEEKGILTDKNKGRLPELCKAVIESAGALLDGIGFDKISKEFLDDLTLLTVGPQLRGGANVKKGAWGINSVFGLIHDIVKHAVIGSTSRNLHIKNSSGRKVLIEFSPDPDIVIREEMTVGSIRNIIAIEVKSGTDFSNIHNRIGEAEKSHQKARMAGYVECWTVVNVDRIDLEIARKESPTTDRFYRLSDLKRGKGKAYEDFKSHVISRAGIAEGE